MEHCFRGVDLSVGKLSCIAVEVCGRKFGEKEFVGVQSQCLQSIAHGVNGAITKSFSKESTSSMHSIREEQQHSVHSMLWSMEPNGRLQGMRHILHIQATYCNWTHSIGQMRLQSKPKGRRDRRVCSFWVSWFEVSKEFEWWAVITLFKSRHLLYRFQDDVLFKQKSMAWMKEREVHLRNSKKKLLSLVLMVIQVKEFWMRIRRHSHLFSLICITKTSVTRSYTALVLSEAHTP